MEKDRTLLAAKFPPKTNSELRFFDDRRAFLAAKFLPKRKSELSFIDETPPKPPRVIPLPKRLPELLDLLREESPKLKKNVRKTMQKSAKKNYPKRTTICSGSAKNISKKSMQLEHKNLTKPVVYRESYITKPVPSTLLNRINTQTVVSGKKLTMPTLTNKINSQTETNTQSDETIINKKEIEETTSKLDTLIDLVKNLHEKFDNVDQEVKKLHQKVDNIDQKLENFCTNGRLRNIDKISVHTNNVAVKENDSEDRNENTSNISSTAPETTKETKFDIIETRNDVTFKEDESLSIIEFEESPERSPFDYEKLFYISPRVSPILRSSSELSIPKRETDYVKHTSSPDLFLESVNKYNAMRNKMKVLCTPKTTKVGLSLMTPSAAKTQEKFLSRKVQEQLLLLEMINTDEKFTLL